MPRPWRWEVAEPWLCFEEGAHSVCWPGQRWKEKEVFVVVDVGS